MKKNKLLIIFIPIFIFLIGIQNVYAASGSYTISSNSTVTVGDTFSVTFKISAKKLYYWQAYINYDTSKLELVSGSKVFQGSAAGKDGGISETSKTLKFKAKKTGSAEISISAGDGDMNLNFDAERLTYSKKSKTITIKEKKNVTYSSNNYLKSLEVEGYKITPDFSKDKLEYSLELPNDVEEINIIANVEDKTASISGAGKQKVSEGANKLKITVTAENGNKKEYIINATVKELDPIEVKVNNESYTIIRKRDELPSVNSSYVVTTAKIGNDEIPALTSEITKYTLVGLKNSNGDIKLYIYNQEKNTYEEYSEFSFNKLTIVLVNDSTIKIPSGYKKTTIKIDNKTIIAYKKSGAYPIFVGMNVETGKTNLYSYDSEENTIQIFKNLSSNNILKIKNDNLYTYTIFGLGAFLIITYTVILINLIKNKKKDKNKKQID